MQVIYDCPVCGLQAVEIYSGDKPEMDSINIWSWLDRKANEDHKTRSPDCPGELKLCLDAL